MLWFVVNTDLTITTEKLVELFTTMDVGINKIVPVYNLDKQLDLPESKVTEMRRHPHNLSQRREAYLDLYVTGHPCPSWRQVAEILRRVGLHYQADTVESTYVQGRERYMCTIMVFIGGLRREGGIVCNFFDYCPPTFTLPCVYMQVEK
jgi:hypothetical protein